MLILILAEGDRVHSFVCLYLQHHDQSARWAMFGSQSQPAQQKWNPWRHWLRLWRKAIAWSILQTAGWTQLKGKSDGAIVAVADIIIWHVPRNARCDFTEQSSCRQPALLLRVSDVLMDLLIKDAMLMHSLKRWTKLSAINREKVWALCCK